jgi:short-subunit dehydrogenase
MTRRVALITGASSGIGAEFARQLAGQSYDLVLCARRTEKLVELGAQLEASRGVRCESLTADLSEETGIASVEFRLRSGGIDLLVNNAGFGIGVGFAEADLVGQQAMISVHVLAPMRLMHAALPSMVERGSGGVINVSSLAAFVSLPGNAGYSATKAYLMRLSRAVHYEVRGRGVTVQALCPGFTVTEFHDSQARAKQAPRAPRFLMGPASAVVRDSLRAFEAGGPLCVPGWINKLAYWTAKLGVADAVIPHIVH